MTFREIAIPAKDERLIEAIAKIEEIENLKLATVYLLQIGIKKYCSDNWYMYDYETGQPKRGDRNGSPADRRDDGMRQNDTSKTV